VKHGDEAVSKSKLQLKVVGPGRMPLVLAAPDVDVKSVRVDEKNDQSYVLLELAGKSKEEVKKLAVENYGNKVQIRDAQGNLIDGGLSFGTYHDTGLALQCQNEAEAKAVANVLGAKSSK
jgi:phosphoribosylformylglycinamidine (FGAM) synthase-like amidotransferase family enzyme